MTPTKDGKGLILSYFTELYSFRCDAPNQCYWLNAGYELKMNRFWHIMMNVPSVLVERCDCTLDSSEDCQCPTGTTGANCGECKEGFWTKECTGKFTL